MTRAPLAGHPRLSLAFGLVTTALGIGMMAACIRWPCLVLYCR